MKTTCSVIQDLLPNYIDRVTSEETNCLIEKHLEECDECRKEYEAMKLPIDEEVLEDIDFLKKVKRKNKKKIVIAIGVTFVLCLGLFSLAKTYVIGEYYEDIFSNPEFLEMDENGNSETISVQVTREEVVDDLYITEIDIEDFDLPKVVIDYRLSKNQYGKQVIEYKVVKKSFVHPKNKRLTIEIPINQIEDDLSVEFLTVDSNGETYDWKMVEMIDNRLEDYYGSKKPEYIYKLLDILDIYLPGREESLMPIIDVNLENESNAISMTFKEKLSDEERAIIERELKVFLSCIDEYDTIYLKDAIKESKVEFKETAKTYKEIKTLFEKYID